MIMTISANNMKMMTLDELKRLSEPAIITVGAAKDPTAVLVPYEFYFEMRRKLGDYEEPVVRKTSHIVRGVRREVGK